MTWSRAGSTYRTDRSLPGGYKDVCWFSFGNHRFEDLLRPCPEANPTVEERAVWPRSSFREYLAGPPADCRAANTHPNYRRNAYRHSDYRVRSDS